MAEISQLPLPERNFTIPGALAIADRLKPMNLICLCESEEGVLTLLSGAADEQPLMPAEVNWLLSRGQRLLLDAMEQA